MQKITGKSSTSIRAHTQKLLKCGEILSPRHGVYVYNRGFRVPPTPRRKITLDDIYTILSKEKEGLTMYELTNALNVEQDIRRLDQIYALTTSEEASNIKISKIVAPSRTKSKSKRKVNLFQLKNVEGEAIE